MSSLMDRFLTIFGDIKVFRFPFWMVYDPGSYKVRGAEMRTIGELLQPGDILLRKYDGYLDGRFIPGFFSHVGLYLGEVLPSEEPAVDDPRVKRCFASGSHMVVHSMAEGVFMEDVLNFLRCDYLGVLRLPETLRAVSGASFPAADRRETWHPDERSLCEDLVSGSIVPRERAVKVARDQALGLLGTEYDFAFDFHDGHRLSCSEFVARCLRGAGPMLGIVPKPRAVLGGFSERLLVEPDAFLDTPLEFLYASPQGHDQMRRKRIARARNEVDAVP